MPSGRLGPSAEVGAAACPGGGGGGGRAEGEEEGSGAERAAVDAEGRQVQPTGPRRPAQEEVLLRPLVFHIWRWAGLRGVVFPVTLVVQ